MQFGKIRRERAASRSRSSIENGQVFTLDLARDPDGRARLADLLTWPTRSRPPANSIDPRFAPEPLGDQTFLAPIDRQEIWAAGVTYKRSKVAREEESRGRGAVLRQGLHRRPARTVPEGHARARRRSRRAGPRAGRQQVERARAGTRARHRPAGKIVGYTIGNDMSARDIEGENPLYLPQAKIYKGSCAVGPLVTPVGVMPALAGRRDPARDRRGGKTAFEGKHDARADGPHHRRASRTGSSGRTSFRTGRSCSPAPASSRPTSSP